MTIEHQSYPYRSKHFYEAPHKLRQTLEDMRCAFGGERKISLARELTKLNEEVYRTTLEGAVTLYGEREPRGEYVLVVDGYTGEIRTEEESVELSMTPEEQVEKYTAEGMSRMDAIKRAAKLRGMSKSELYKILEDSDRKSTRLNSSH